MEMKFTLDNFEKEVLQSEIPVLVDFFADWCGPCKMMAPVVRKMAAKFRGKVKVGKINIDDDMALAQKYHVAGVPTFMIFKGGQVDSSSTGAMSETDLEAKLAKVLA
jgi:thioredoxin 1